MTTAEDVDGIIGAVKTSTHIDFETSFKYAKLVAAALNDDKHADYARRIIINILDNWKKVDDSTKDIWIDLMEAAGFYPYIEKQNFSIRDTGSKIRKEYHKSDLITGTYFHEEQRLLKDLLNSEKNVIVSAPTSFGKSLLIEELIASRKYCNIVIIQPTLALLDETRRRLLKYRADYRLIVKTSQKPAGGEKNIFLLTAERVMEYKDLPKIDLLILDEFYKLSAKRDDERSDVLNNAFYKLITKFNCKFYLLGPNIDEISKGFAEKFNAIFFRTNYSLVDSEVVNVFEKYGNRFGNRGTLKEFKEEVLFKLLLNDLNKEQTIIYCSSPNRVRYLAKTFSEYLTKNKVASENKYLPLQEWIRKNIDPRWSILTCLSYGIGIHDGALPKHITTSVIDYFNSGKLKYLFCTSTIIEGVNTSAKNVVFFDSTKGNKSIDYFDYCNIKGRAGRMMVHFTGRMYDFNEPITRNQVIIDIPFFEQNPIADEVLIQLNGADVNNKTSEQYKKINLLSDAERKLFKKNGVSVWGQKDILDFLDSRILELYHLINWTGFPKGPQLKLIIDCCWDHLLKPEEAKLITRQLTKKHLNWIVREYGINHSISKVIENRFRYKRIKETDKTDQELVDDSVLWAFQIQRSWLHYKVPKWIRVFNELQKFVCVKNALKPGEYSYFASQLENDFVHDNLAILLEFGIPLSAVRKLETAIPNNVPEDEVLNIIKTKGLLTKLNFLPYEIKKLEENL